MALIEADDGGIFRRTSPKTNTGDWFSVSGTLQISEVYSIAYDNNSNTIFGGMQDNGTTRRHRAAGSSTTWRGVQGGDGGDVSVDTFTLAGVNRSIRYSRAELAELSAARFTTIPTARSRRRH